MRNITVTPWSDAEREQLRRLHENGLSQGQIASMMGRSKGSIHRQFAILGLVSADRNPVQRAVSLGTHPKSAILPRARHSTLPPLPSLMDDMP